MGIRYVLIEIDQYTLTSTSTLQHAGIRSAAGQRAGDRLQRPGAIRVLP